MRVKSRTFAISAAAILISTICLVALYWYLGQRQAINGLEAASNRTIWYAATCRAGLFWQKARGEVREVSWTVLWQLTVPGKGFDCNDRGSLEAGLRYSAIASEEDRAAGGRFFRQRRTGGDGLNGSSGPGVPSLRCSGYNHRDSDLAILEVLRHGVSGMAMPSAGLPTPELLQVVAYLRVLQAQPSGDHRAAISHLDIQVSSEQLRAAGADTAEWLTYSGSYNGWRHIARPNNPSKHGSFANPVFASDAATGKRIWAYTSPSGSFGGLLSTDGALVLDTWRGVFFALDADTRRQVRRTPLGGNTNSAPISFTVDGQPVIALAAGRPRFGFGL